MVPSLWPILPHLNPQPLCEIAPPNKANRRTDVLTIELQLVWCRWIPNGVVRDESWIPGLEGILDGIESNLSTISKKQTSTLIHALLEHPRWQETHYFIEQPENRSRALFTRLRTASSQMSPAGLGLEHRKPFIYLWDYVVFNPFCPQGWGQCQGIATLNSESVRAPDLSPLH